MAETENARQEPAASSAPCSRADGAPDDLGGCGAPRGSRGRRRPIPSAMRVDFEELARTLGNGVAASDGSDVPVKRSARGAGSSMGDVGEEGAAAAAAWPAGFATHP